MPQPEPIAWRGDCLRILDQTRLPAAVEYVDARSAAEVAEAIRRLAVRGAPLIGIAAANSGPVYVRDVDCRFVERMDRWGNLYVVKVCD